MRPCLKTLKKGHGDLLSWVKAAATNPDSQSLIPGTYGVEGQSPANCPLTSNMLACGIRVHSRVCATHTQ